MMKIYKAFGCLILISTIFTSCTSYQLASYYDDGIYSSAESGIDYKVEFSNYANQPVADYSSNNIDFRNLPWGENPDSIEIVNNFFPNFGGFYYNPFFHPMAFNPFYSNSGRFINYGYRLPFFFDSFAYYELGYPFYGPRNWYFSPYATALGNYYWYNMRYSRNYPWYYGRNNYYNAYKDKYGNERSSTRLSYSNSASRRGEKNSASNSNTIESRSKVSRVPNIYPRIAPYGSSNITRNNNFDVVERRSEPSRNFNNNLIGVYSNRDNGYNRNNSVPNLSEIKSNNIRRAYREVRSVNPSQIGNSYNRSSGYQYSRSTPNYSNSSSNRSRSNSSYSNNNFSRSSNSRPTQSSSFRSSSSRSSSGLSSGGSRGGSRGGKIN